MDSLLAPAIPYCNIGKNIEPTKVVPCCARHPSLDGLCVHLYLVAFGLIGDLGLLSCHRGYSKIA